MENIKTAASSLYGGGWRASDREELVTEYVFTQEEVEQIIALLLKYENETYEITYGDR